MVWLHILDHCFWWGRAEHVKSRAVQDWYTAIVLSGENMLEEHFDLTPERVKEPLVPTVGAVLLCVWQPVPDWGPLSLVALGRWFLSKPAENLSFSRWRILKITQNMVLSSHSFSLNIPSMVYHHTPMASHFFAMVLVRVVPYVAEQSTQYPFFLLLKFSFPVICGSHFYPFCWNQMKSIYVRYFPPFRWFPKNLRGFFSTSPMGSPFWPRSSWWRDSVTSASPAPIWRHWAAPLLWWRIAGAATQAGFEGAGKTRNNLGQCGSNQDFFNI